MLSIFRQRQGECQSVQRAPSPRRRRRRHIISRAARLHVRCRRQVGIGPYWHAEEFRHAGHLEQLLVARQGFDEAVERLLALRQELRSNAAAREPRLARQLRQRARVAPVAKLVIQRAEIGVPGKRRVGARIWEGEGRVSDEQADDTVTAASAGRWVRPDRSRMRVLLTGAASATGRARPA